MLYRYAAILIKLHLGVKMILNCLVSPGRWLQLYKEPRVLRNHMQQYLEQYWNQSYGVMLLYHSICDPELSY